MAVSSWFGGAVSKAAQQAAQPAAPPAAVAEKQSLLTKKPRTGSTQKTVLTSPLGITTGDAATQKKGLLGE